MTRASVCARDTSVRWTEGDLETVVSHVPKPKRRSAGRANFRYETALTASLTGLLSEATLSRNLCAATSNVTALARKTSAPASSATAKAARRAHGDFGLQTRKLQRAKLENLDGAVEQGREPIFARKSQSTNASRQKSFLVRKNHVRESRHCVYTARNGVGANRLAPLQGEARSGLVQHAQT
jgi:hypothetical protein